MHQFKLQVEFSDRFELLFDAPPIKPPVFQPNKPPQFEWWTSSPDAAVEPNLRAGTPNASVAFELELWTTSFVIAIRAIYDYPFYA